MLCAVSWMWATRSDSVTETGILFLVDLWFPLLEFFDYSRAVEQCVCTCPCRYMYVCVCVYRVLLCAFRSPSGRQQFISEMVAKMGFVLSGVRSDSRRPGFPVARRCGRINYRDIEWQASKAGLMSKGRRWRGCGAGADHTSKNLLHLKKSII